MEDQEQIRQFLEKAESIADYLKLELVRREETDKHVTLVRGYSNGRPYGLYLQLNWRNPSQIYVSGCWPLDDKGRHVLYNGSSTKDCPEGINVSINKSAEQISKDIKRRYLPEYLKAEALALERINSSRSFHKERYVMLTEIGRLIGSEPNETQDGDWTLSAWNTIPGLESVKASGTSEVELKVCLPFDKAAKLVKLLVTL